MDPTSNFGGITASEGVVVGVIAGDFVEGRVGSGNGVEGGSVGGKGVEVGSGCVVVQVETNNSTNSVNKILFMLFPSLNE